MRRLHGVSGRPVRLKKTSSRLGRCRESSVTAMPAAASRGTTAVSAASLGDVHGDRGLRLALDRARADRLEQPGDLADVRGVDRADPQGLAADDPLEPVRGVVRDDPAGSMTVISSASASASSRYCVVSSTVAPSRTRPRTTSQTSSRLAGSRPVVGSSRKTTDGRPTRLAARSSRRRIPPL